MGGWISLTYLPRAIIPLISNMFDTREKLASGIKLKGKWQQKFLSAYLKETPKQFIEVYYRIFISALFGEIF